MVLRIANGNKYDVRAVECDIFQIKGKLCAF